MPIITIFLSLSSDDAIMEFLFGFSKQAFSAPQDKQARHYLTPDRAVSIIFTAKRSRAHLHASSHDLFTQVLRAGCGGPSACAPRVCQSARPVSHRCHTQLCAIPAPQAHTTTVHTPQARRPEPRPPAGSQRAVRENFFCYPGRLSKRQVPLLRISPNTTPSPLHGSFSSAPSPASSAATRGPDG